LASWLAWMPDVNGMTAAAHVSQTLGVAGVVMIPRASAPV
jgi:hypothetical protein